MLVGAFARLQLAERVEEEAEVVDAAAMLRIQPSTMTFFTPRHFNCRASNDPLTWLKHMGAQQRWSKHKFEKMERELNEEIAGLLVHSMDKREALLFLVRTFALAPAADVPDLSNTKCKQLIATKLYANIYDLISGRYVNHHSRLALRNYSVSKRKVFCLEQAKTHPVSRLLLHQLF